jgi:hypothetical protein
MKIGNWKMRIEDALRASFSVGSWLAFRRLANLQFPIPNSPFF